MDLLGLSVRPIGWHVTRGELNAYGPFARFGDDAVKSIVCDDRSSDHPGPE
jgi:hypothetical protein